MFQRCKAFKQDLCEFNFKEFSKISERAKQATKDLEDAQLAADQDTDNIALQEHLKVLKQKTKLLVTSERKFYSQKAEIKNLIQGDKNTAFSHSMVKTNNARNSISLDVGKMEQSWMIKIRSLKAL